MSSTNYHEALDRYRELVAALDAAMSIPPCWPILRLSARWKDRSEKAEVLAVLEELVRVQTTWDEANEILNGSREADLIELARIEAAESEALLIPLRKKEPTTSLPARSRTMQGCDRGNPGRHGGEEAALFASELYRMYTRWAERQGGPSMS
jgi:peptide chain release factor 1